MSKQKSKWILLSVLFIVIVIVAGFLSKGLIASWLTKETLQSSVEISLLLQGDEADIYESPVTLTSRGTYELATVGIKDTDGNYVGNEVSADEKTEPSRQNLYDYVMPGVNIPKDPKVFITKKSGAPAYLYIEVIEDNFPKYYTDDGFEKLSVDTDNAAEIKPIYYELEEFWVPVVQDDGVTPATGKNGGKLYVYYNNTNDYFENYNKEFPITVGEGAGAQTFYQYVTCLSSYIMKPESDGHITKHQYYGTNEVKTVNGQPIDCPYFNILKKDTIYVSEKYIHSEYYSGLYTDLGKKAENRSETVKYGYDFGLYFNSYMASAKINGEYANPYKAFAQAGFISEKEYLIEQYRANDGDEPLRNETGTPKGNLVTDGRVVYVWNEAELHTAVDDYFGDGLPYKVVLLRDIPVNKQITVTPNSNFEFDMNSKTLSATDLIGTGFFYRQERNTDVTITGNGVFSFGPKTKGIVNFEKMTIENGSFVRDYDYSLDSKTIRDNYYCIFAPVSSATSHTIILDGYFDNGYWCLDKDGGYDGGKKNNGLYPKYDTVGGTGWITDENGEYITGEFDASAMHNGYGPEPDGLLFVLGIGSNAKATVYGGTFVGQNPAWGDEGCATEYIYNPYGDSFYSNTQGTFLEGQGRLDTDIPDWYEIDEGNKKYSYTDENGNLIEFYVPTYTVKYDDDLKQKRIQTYNATDVDEEDLSSKLGTPGKNAENPLQQNGRIVYVFSEEELKLAVDDYFGDGELYKIVLMNDINVINQIKVPATADFIFDMNEHKLSAVNDSYTRDVLWIQTYASETVHSNVVIRGNGTFDLGNCNVCCFVGFGNLVIEDGYYIRDYDPTRTATVAEKFSFFVGAPNTNVIINGGYFDNGYWYQSNEFSVNTSYYQTDDKQLPVYDTLEGKGWAEVGGKYETVLPGAPNYGPDPYGVCQILCKNSNPTCVTTVYGGTFVLQNPAWGDELCAQAYTKNPYGGLYYSNAQGTFLKGQAMTDENLPDGYTIEERNTEYSYINDAGEFVKFFVPTYTVKYNGQAVADTE